MGAKLLGSAVWIAPAATFHPVSPLLKLPFVRVPGKEKAGTAATAKLRARRRTGILIEDPPIILKCTGQTCDVEGTLTDINIV